VKRHSKGIMGSRKAGHCGNILWLFGTATLLLDAGMDVRKVQDFLGRAPQPRVNRAMRFLFSDNWDHKDH
jgi:hypothetical protein